MISSRALAAYRNRKFTDYGWMKELTERQLRTELASLRVTPKFRTEPWLHQLVCFYIGVCCPQFLYLLDMGTGKTWILLNLLQQALRERRVRRGLVMVPRVLNVDSWMTAAAEHSVLEPCAIPSGEIAAKWDALMNPGRTDFTIIDYQGLALAVSKKHKGKRGKACLVRDDDKMRALCAKYDWIGLDESHKVANHQNLWFSILSELTRHARSCYAATGTLFGADIEDVWSQFYLIDGGETFGTNLGAFRQTFFTAQQDNFKGQKLVYNRDMSDLLHRMIGHRSVRYEDYEVADLPKVVARRVLCSMTSEQRDHYLRALEGLINADGVLSEMDAAWTRMRQITSGYLVWKDQYGDHQLNFKQNPKLDELELWVDEAGANKVIINTEYTSSGALVTQRLKERGIKHEWLYGGTKDPVAVVNRFKRDDDCRVLVMNSASGGEGTDGLQHVCRYLLMYESPPGPSARQQLIKRLHRPGQQRRTYVVDFCAERTVDVGLLDNVQAGRDLYEAVISGKFDRNIFFGPV